MVDEARGLIGKITYERGAYLERAPHVADCLTSIWFLFLEKIRSIPLTYIGDMPRRLLSFEDWTAHKINWKDVRCGDLLFVKNRERTKLIAHVALILSSSEIFHCSASLGAVIQTKDEFFKTYEQRVPFPEVALYIDPRNKILRQKNGGIFLSI